MSPQGDLKNIFAANACPDEATLKRYAFHQLEGKEKRAVELHLADCEICSDMVEGMQAAGSLPAFNQDVAELKEKAELLIREKQSKVIPIFRERSYAVAAVILVLIGFGFFIRYFMNRSESIDMAQNVQPMEKELIAPPPPIQESSETISNAPSQHKDAVKSIQEALPKSNSFVPPVKTLTEPHQAQEIEKNKSTDANFSSGKAVLQEVAEESISTGSAMADDLEKDSKADVRGDNAVTAPGVAISTEAKPAAAAPRSTNKKESAVNYSIADKNNFSTAETAFNQGDYAKAKSLLRADLDRDPENESALFLMAKTERLLKNYASSNSYFNSLIQLNNKTYKEESNWQMALNYKDNKQVKEAKELLQQIAKGKGKYAYPAAELLGELDE